MSIRIYNAAFAPGTAGTHHQHLGTFWWIDDSGSQGQWTRPEAHVYCRDHRGDVYVAEGNLRAIVIAYHNDTNGTKWVQTAPDSALPDNLLTLAKRHAQGLPNR
jgi:Protein of unknown function (DUF3892)